MAAYVERKEEELLRVKCEGKGGGMLVDATAATAMDRGWTRAQS